MAQQSLYRDYFPGQVTTVAESVKLKEKDFVTFLSEGMVRVFTVYLIKDEVVMRDILGQFRDDRVRSNNYKTNFKNASELLPFDNKKILWESVERRLSKNLKSKAKNCDTRTSYRIGKHRFLVKKYFTFGQRTVARGTRHVLQTTEAPMLIFKLPKECAIRPRERQFKAGDQRFYKRFVLQPETRYAIPEGSTYILITVQPTLFSVHVHYSECAKGEDPFHHKQMVSDPYRVIIAPPTPAHPPLFEDRVAMPPPPKKRKDEKTHSLEAPKKHKSHHPAPCEERVSKRKDASQTKTVLKPSGKPRSYFLQKQKEFQPTESVMPSSQPTESVPGVESVMPFSQPTESFPSMSVMPFSQPTESIPGVESTESMSIFQPAESIVQQPVNNSPQQPSSQSSLSTDESPQHSIVIPGNVERNILSEYIPKASDSLGSMALIVQPTIFVKGAYNYPPPECMTQWLVLDEHIRQTGGDGDPHPKPLDLAVRKKTIAETLVDVSNHPAGGEQLQNLYDEMSEDPKVVERMETYKDSVADELNAALKSIQEASVCLGNMEDFDYNADLFG